MLLLVEKNTFESVMAAKPLADVISRPPQQKGPGEPIQTPGPDPESEECSAHPLTEDRNLPSPSR